MELGEQTKSPASEPTMPPQSGTTATDAPAADAPEQPGTTTASVRGTAQSTTGDPGLSRRSFLKASAAVGAAVLVAAAAATLEGCDDDDDAENPDEETYQPTPSGEDPVPVSVSPEQLLEATNFTEHSLYDFFEEPTSLSLPHGTIVHQINDSLALALTPRDQGRALIDISLLDLNSGRLTKVLDRASGVGNGHPDAIIYDARASESALAWAECDIATLQWQVYVAAITSDEQGNTSPGEAILVDRGSADYEVPLLAVAGSKVYWTVMPNPSGSAQYADSYLKAANAGVGDAKIVHTSHGRMITTPLVNQDTLTFAPRVDTKNVYYELTALRVRDDRLITAPLVMPQSVRVLDAIYLDKTFCFSIENNYSYAGGLGVFGTYWQLDKESEGRWLHLYRKPTAAPVLLSGRLVIKSTTRVIAIDAENESYCSIPTLPDSADYGDILAGWGNQQRLVLYSNVSSSSARSQARGVLRIFKPYT